MPAPDARARRQWVSVTENARFRGGGKVEPSASAAGTARSDDRADDAVMNTAHVAAPWFWLAAWRLEHAVMLNHSLCRKTARYFPRKNSD
jgi:hypothetical protein